MIIDTAKSKSEYLQWIEEFCQAMANKRHERDLHIHIKEMHNHIRENELKKKKMSLNNVKKL
jgi:hypothetical protein